MIPATVGAKTAFTSVPTLVDRQEEIKRITAALEGVSKGNGQLLIFRGEGGCGKTRLVQESVSMAEGRGFAVGFGTGLAESITPYSAWRESLSSLGLAHILDDLPPPRLMGLYLFTHDRELVAKVEREDISGVVTSTVTHVVCEPTKIAGIAMEGPLTTCRLEENRILVLHANGFTTAAVVQGNEDEALLSDLRELAVTAGSSGGMASTAKTETSESPFEESLQRLLDSGKYEGIDYVKDDPKLKQQRLFDRTAMALARKAETCPVTLAFDDLQWADPSSLALLHYVTRNTRQSRVLLLGSYRVEESGVRQHLKEALQRMDKEGLLVEVPLTGLGREDMNRLAESFLGAHALPEDFLDLLWRETQGYPLFVREVLRQLEEEKAVEMKGALKRLVRPLDKLSIPHRVREVIRTRIDRLQREDRELLEAAATCGTRFTAAFVAKVAGEIEGTISPSLEKLSRIHGLLRPTENGFVFDHPVVQEIVYSGIPTGVKQTFHREAAQWLELVGGPVEDVAEHYYRANDPRAPPRLRDAAEAARARCANNEAVRFYREALEFQDVAVDRREMLLHLGSLHEILGEWDQSMESTEEALKLSTAENERAEVLVQISRLHAPKGEYKESLRICKEALALVRGKGIPEEARALKEIGSIYYFWGDNDEALENLNESLSIYEKVGDNNGVDSVLNAIGNVFGARAEYGRALECYMKSLEMAQKAKALRRVAIVLRNIGFTYGNLGNLNKSLEYHEKSLHVAEQAGSPIEAAHALISAGITQYDLGNYDQALQRYTACLNLKRRIGDYGGIAGLFHEVGLVHLAKGNFREAIENVKELVQDAERTGSKWGLSHGLCVLGQAYRGLGEYDEALKHLQRSVKLAEQIDDKRGLACHLRGLGNVRIDLGEFDHASEDFDRSLKLSESIDDEAGVAEALCCQAELRAVRDSQEEARELCNRAVALARKIGMKELDARTAGILGMIHREQGEWDESIQAFERSTATYSRMGRVADAARAHFEFGLMWKKKGDTDKAMEHLNMALRTFERLKLSRDAEKVYKAIEVLKT